MSLLELRDVTRTVIPPDQPALTILNGVDLRVEPGDRISIVGRSVLTALGLSMRANQRRETPVTRTGTSNCVLSNPSAA